MLLAAAPPDGRFVLEVGGLPVAELRVSVTGDRYVYESTQFLTEGTKEHRIELRLEGPQPEVLALLKRPALGCRDVLEERSQKLEPLCVEKSSHLGASGTIAGEAFAAHYDDAGALRDITVGAAHWFAAARATAPPLENPFIVGLGVPDGVLKLEPAVAGARWLTRPPVGIGTPETVGRVRCLILAREAASLRPKSRVTVGLVVEEGRAYPHAWLTEGSAALDPSVRPGDPSLAQRRYLEVPVERSGAFFLQLFDGAVRLVAK